MQGRCKPSAIELALIAEAQPVFAVFDRKDTNYCGVFQIYRLHSCLLLLAGATSAILLTGLVELPGEIDQESATGGVVNRQFADAVDDGVGLVGVEEVNAAHIKS